VLKYHVQRQHKGIKKGEEPKLIMLETYVLVIFEGGFSYSPHTLSRSVSLHFARFFVAST